MINGEVVTAKTLDQILLHIALPTTVILKTNILGLRICITYLLVHSLILLHVLKKFNCVL